MELDPYQKPGPEVLKFEKKAIKWNLKRFKFWKRLTQTLAREPPTNNL
jgi:hypothetical protein